MLLWGICCVSLAFSFKFWAENFSYLYSLPKIEVERPHLKCIPSKCGRSTSENKGNTWRERAKLCIRYSFPWMWTKGGPGLCFQGNVENGGSILHITIWWDFLPSLPEAAGAINYCFMSSGAIIWPELVAIWMLTIHLPAAIYDIHKCPGRVFFRVEMKECYAILSSYIRGTCFHRDSTDGTCGQWLC